MGHGLFKCEKEYAPNKVNRHIRERREKKRKKSEKIEEANAKIHRATDKQIFWAEAKQAKKRAEESAKREMKYHGPR